MRVSARMTGAALVVTAALALTGCNSTGSSHHSSKHKGRKSSSSSHKSSGSSSKHKGSSTSGTSGTSGSGGFISTGRVQGTWESGGLGDPDYAVMGLMADGSAMIKSADASCAGTFQQLGRTVQVKMTCKKGHGYEVGKVKKASGSKLTVHWQSGHTDHFNKSDM